MAVTVAAGMPTYTGYSIPELWPEDMLTDFFAATTISQIATTDYEDDLKHMGDVAHIRIMPTFTKKIYYPGMTLSASNSAPTKVDLSIDTAYYYDENIDRVISQQSNVRLKEEYSKALAQKMAVDVDETALAGIQTGAGADNVGATAGVKTAKYNLGATGAYVSITENNALPKLMDLLAVLWEQNVPKTNAWVLIPSWYSRKLKTSEVMQANEMGDKTSIMRTGFLGKFDGVEIFESNNMTGVTDGTVTAWYALAGHTSAVGFAATIDEFRIVQPTDTFSDQLQLLNVFGYKVLRSKYLAALYCTPTE